jgi:hypothetical protein
MENKHYWRFIILQINLNKPMADVLSELNKLNVQSRVNLTGTLIVARDIAHAKLKERLDSGSPLPEYFKKHPVIYAGPSKTPEVRRLHHLLLSYHRIKYHHHHCRRRRRRRHHHHHHHYHHHHHHHQQQQHHHHQQQKHHHYQQQQQHHHHHHLQQQQVLINQNKR